MKIEISIFGDPFIPAELIKKTLIQEMKRFKIKHKVSFKLKNFKNSQLVPFNSKEISEAFGKPRDVIKISKKSHILITTFAPVNKEVIDNCENLLIIACGRGGPININIDYATKKNIAVFFAPGRNISAVVEYTLANIINLIRKIPSAIDYIKKKNWTTPLEDTFLKPSGFELDKKTVGIIGYGAIGKKLSKALHVLDAKLLIYEPISTQFDNFGRKFKSSLNDLIKNSDIISIHARISKNNKPLIRSHYFKQMKKKPFIVNTSRSQCVKTSDLIKAYKKKQIKGFYLDVFDNEPIPNNGKLFKMIGENIQLTPHAAGVSKDIPVKTAQIIANNLLNLLSGKKIINLSNVVNLNLLRKNLLKNT